MSGDQDINKLFGKHLSQFRDSLGLTQEEFAWNCNITTAYLGQLERGIKSPTLNTLYKIADNTNIDLPKLISFNIPIKPATDQDVLVNKITSRLTIMSDQEKQLALDIIKVIQKQ